MREGAPQLHEPDTTHPNAGQHKGDIYDATHNIAAHEVIEHGDFDAALREADVIVEGEYRVPYISYAVLCLQENVAYLDGYERMIVISSTQVPYHTRRQLAAVLPLPISRVRIVKPRVAAGFVSKQEMRLEPFRA